MAIAVKIQIGVLLPSDPFFGQLRVPSHCPPQIQTQQLQLRTQRPHFRDLIQAQQFAPLTRRLAAQLFKRPNSCQSHEPQQQEDTVDTIESIGQLIHLRAIAQQTLGQQSRQCQQHSALSHIAGRLKFDWRRCQQSHRRRDTLQRTYRSISHRRLAVALAALAFGGDYCRAAESVFFGGAGKRPARIALCSVLANTFSSLDTSGTLRPCSSSARARSSTSPFSTDAELSRDLVS